MSEKNDNKESLGDELLNLENENENEIIEKIINNSLLNENLDLEEDIEEEDYEINEEKFVEGNKLSFIINEEEEEKELKENEDIEIPLKKNRKKACQIYQDFIGNLLIELYEYHFSQLSKEKKRNLTKSILETKYYIEFFSIQFNANFSKYILCILEQKIYELIEYVMNGIKENKDFSLKGLFKIKETLHILGNDIMKIFEKIFLNTKKFDIPSIIIFSFISGILSENYLDKISEEEYEQITENVFLEEKIKFENYLEECKLSLYSNEEEDDKNNNKEEEKEKEDIQDDNEIKPKQNIQFNEEEKQINNNNNEKNNNINDNKEKMSTNNDDNDINKKVNEEKTQNYSNLEELVEYINDNDNKKKKKKRRRKKKDKQNSANFEEKKEIEVDEKDIIYENFKSNLIDFSKSLCSVKKIKPIISDAFLEKLKLMS